MNVEFGRNLVQGRLGLLRLDLVDGFKDVVSVERVVNDQEVPRGRRWPGQLSPLYRKEGGRVTQTTELCVGRIRVR